jgi:hypothetical protein
MWILQQFLRRMQLCWEDIYVLAKLISTTILISFLLMKKLESVKYITGKIIKEIYQQRIFNDDS